MRQLTVMLLVPLALAVGAGAAKPKSAQPRTLVAAHGRIYAFAQDGDRIGWVAADARVRVRRLTTRKTWIVGKVDPERASSSAIAVAGKRAVWAWDSGGNNVEESIVTGAPGRRPAFVDVLSGDPRGTGGGVRFGGVAGDGAMLAYGWVVEQCVNRPLGLCDSPFTDPLVVTGGGVTLVPAAVTGQGPPAIAGVAPPAMFAVAHGRVVVLPARSPTPAGEWVPRVAEDGPVEVYDLGGHLLMRVSRPGIVRDVALFGHKLAVLLEQPDESKLILRFDARNGTYLSQSSRLPIGTTDLSTGTGGIVFRVGREIYTLRGRTPRLLARAAATPIGLSIEGRRVGWAENVRGHGRIRALTLP